MNFNFMKKNAKHLWMAVMLIFLFLMLGLGLGLSAFGMGMESQRFITSVDRMIDKYIPQGKVVLDGSAPPILGGALDVYQAGIEVLRGAYQDDVLSTLTTAQKDDQSIVNFFKNYALENFEKDWQAKYTAKQDIDVNEFSHTLVKFDVKVAKQFHNYAFTHSGLAWIGKKNAASQLLSTNFPSSELYQEAHKNETIIDQAQYTSGLYLVNNKVAFINQQIQGIVTIASDPLLGSVLKDASGVLGVLTSDDDQKVAVEVLATDLYHPNFTIMYYQTRLGVVFLIILTPLLGTFILLYSLMTYQVFLRMNWSKNLWSKMKVNKAPQSPSIE